MHQQDTDAGPSRIKSTPAEGDGANNGLGTAFKEEEAAIMIQKHYRGHRSRQHHASAQLSVCCFHLGMKLISRNKDARWGELIKNSEEHTYAQEQLENRNDVRSRSVPVSRPSTSQLLEGRLMRDGEEDSMPPNAFNSEMA